MPTLKNIQTKIALPLTALQKDLDSFARVLSIKKDFNVIVMDDPSIRALNKRFLDEDEPTDVLAFPTGSGNLLGEIVVSIQTAQDNARYYRTTTGYEVRLYIVHGLLHLLGYRDHTDKEQRRMHQLAIQTLRRSGIAV